MFGGRLHTVNLVNGEITFFDFAAYGAYVPSEDAPSIHVSSIIKTRKLLLETLAHEMVHQWQHQHKLPLTHGPLFKRYAAKFLKYGMIL